MSDPSLAAIQMSVESILKIMEKNGVSGGTASALGQAAQAKDVKEYRKRLQEAAKSMDIEDKKRRDLTKELDNNTKETKKNSAAIQLTTRSLQAMGAGLTSFVGFMLVKARETMQRSLDLERAGAGALLRSISSTSTSIGGLNRIATDLGLSLSTLTDIFTRSSGSIGVIGSQQFLSITRRLQGSFRNLGMTAEEGTRRFASFIERNATYVATRDMTEAQVFRYAQRNMVQMEGFSTALKLSRDEIERRQAIDAENAEAQLVASFMPTEVRQSLDAMRAVNPAAAEAMASMYASQVRYGTAAGSTAYQNAAGAGLGDQYMRMFQQMMSGSFANMDATQIAEAMSNGLSTSQAQRRYMLQAGAVGVDVNPLAATTLESDVNAARLRTGTTGAATDTLVGTATDIVNSLELIKSRLEQLLQKFLTEDFFAAISSFLGAMASALGSISPETAATIGRVFGEFVLGLSNAIVDLANAFTGTGSWSQALDSLMSWPVALAAALLAPGLMATLATSIVSSVGGAIRLGMRGAGAAFSRLGGQAALLAGSGYLGWQAGSYISENYVEPNRGVSDAIGGTINSVVNGVGGLFGQEWGVSREEAENYYQMSRNGIGLNAPTQPNRPATESPTASPTPTPAESEIEPAPPTPTAATEADLLRIIANSMTEAVELLNRIQRNQNDGYLS